MGFVSRVLLIAKLVRNSRQGADSKLVTTVTMKDGAGEFGAVMCVNMPR